METGFFVYTPRQYAEFMGEADIIEYGLAPEIPTGVEHRFFHDDKHRFFRWRVISLNGKLCFGMFRRDTMLLYSTGIDFTAGTAIAFGPAAQSVFGYADSTVQIGTKYVDIRQDEDPYNPSVSVSYFDGRKRITTYDIADFYRSVSDPSIFPVLEKELERAKAYLDFNNRVSDAVVTESSFDTITLEDNGDELCFGDDRRLSEYYVIPKAAMVQLSLLVGTIGAIVDSSIQTNTKFVELSKREYKDDFKDDNDNEDDNEHDDEDDEVEDIGEVEFTDEEVQLLIAANPYAFPLEASDDQDDEESHEEDYGEEDEEDEWQDDWDDRWEDDGYDDEDEDDDDDAETIVLLICQ